MKLVMEYFDMPIAQFRAEWQHLTPSDKVSLKEGIENGTLTY